MLSDNILSYKKRHHVDITFKDRLCTNDTNNTVSVVEDDIISILFIDRMNDLCVVRGKVKAINEQKTRDGFYHPIFVIDYSTPNRSNLISIPVDIILDIQAIDFDYKVGFEERYGEQARANFNGESFNNINNETFSDLSMGARIKTGGKERREWEEFVFKAMKTIKELK